MGWFNFVVIAMAPFLSPLSVPSYVLTEHLHISAVNKELEQEPNRDRAWPLFRHRLELSEKVSTHITHLQHKATATPRTKSQPPSEVWHWKWYSGNKITRGPEILLQSHNKKDNALWCFQVQRCCFRVKQRKRSLFYVFFPQHVEVLFKLVGVMNRDENWSQPSFQDKYNNPVCAVAMAFTVPPEIFLFVCLLS